MDLKPKILLLSESCLLVYPPEKLSQIDYQTFDLLISWCGKSYSFVQPLMSLIMGLTYGNCVWLEFSGFLLMTTGSVPWTGNLHIKVSHQKQLEGRIMTFICFLNEIFKRCLTRLDFYILVPLWNFLLCIK